MDAKEFLDKLDLSDPKTASRAKSALKVKVAKASADGETEGSSGELYTTTLGTCSCIDWTRRKDKENPCKHQIALALAIMEQGGADTSELVAKFKGKPEAPKEDKPKPAPKPRKGHTLAFCFKEGDPVYDRLCELGKENGYANVNALCYDIVVKWVADHSAETDF